MGSRDKSPESRAVSAAALDLPRACVAQWGEESLLGPAVVTCVYLNGQGERALAPLDLSRWASLGGEELRSTARHISKVVAFDSIMLLPRKWNTLLAKLSPRHRLLNWLYRRTIGTILERYADCRAVAFDRHSPAFAVLETEIPRGATTPLLYRPPRADDAGLFAAGLLARSSYYQGIQALERKLGESLPEEPEAGLGLVRRLIDTGGLPAALHVAKKDDPRLVELLASSGTGLPSGPP
ncbi:MAG: hypothetical protein HY815_14710 [Candidatus Riflebacteria bacterium]|nr:hypothetical protein [Candidatus Riflebacteria bacterium]